VTFFKTLCYYLLLPLEEPPLELLDEEPEEELLLGEELLEGLEEPEDLDGELVLTGGV
jgi:hypothetical protein